MGDEKKPTVFYVVRVDGDRRTVDDLARSATRADAEKHLSDLPKPQSPSVKYEIEEREEEPHPAWLDERGNVKPSAHA